MKTQSRLAKRAKIIKYIYQFEVMEQKLSATEAFESGDYNQQEIKIIESIVKNYHMLKKIIVAFIKTGWTWIRLAPLERAILLFGAFELKLTDHALVINELVIITKGYIPGASYQFIHAILDKIGRLYDQQAQRH